MNRLEVVDLLFFFSLFFSVLIVSSSKIAANSPCFISVVHCTNFHSFFPSFSSVNYFFFFPSLKDPFFWTASLPAILYRNKRQTNITVTDSLPTPSPPIHLHPIPLLLCTSLFLRFPPLSAVYYCCCCRCLFSFF